VSGKACLNPVSEHEDLQYKLATMQALRYMAQQDSMKNLDNAGGSRTAIKLSKPYETGGTTTSRD